MCFCYAYFIHGVTYAVILCLYEFQRKICCENKYDGENTK